MISLTLNSKKSKQAKQNRNRFTGTENNLVVARRVGEEDTQEKELEDMNCHL